MRVWLGVGDCFLEIYAVLSFIVFKEKALFSASIIFKIIEIENNTHFHLKPTDNSRGKPTHGQISHY